jgi:hypothetical protein
MSTEWKQVFRTDQEIDTTKIKLGAVFRQSNKQPTTLSPSHTNRRARTKESIAYFHGSVSVFPHFAHEHHGDDGDKVVQKSIQHLFFVPD